MKKIFKLNHNANQVLLGKEVGVYLQGHEDRDGKVTYSIYSIEETHKWMEVPSNYITTLGDVFQGVVRIQGYLIKDNWEIKPMSLSTGMYTTMLMDTVYRHRKVGILAVSKAKSQSDLIYLFKGLKDGQLPLLQELLQSGKLFKEYQRMLGTDQIVPETPFKRVNCVVVDLDEYFAHNGYSIKEASDGKAISKWDCSVTYGDGVIEEQYSFGFRIIGHTNIRTSKGNLNFNIGEFNKLCDYFNLDKDKVDIILPLTVVKVGKDIKTNTIYDITKHLRLVSYKTDKTQSYARLSTVACITHAQYSQVFSHIVNNSTYVDETTDLISRSIEGRLDAFVKLIKASNANDLLGSALFAAFPIWNQDRWSLIRSEEAINNLYMQATSAHTKHVRKVRVKAAFNRRASHNLEVEKLNHNNNTGVYFVDIRKGVINIPQHLFVQLGLGDYDGDDVVIYPILVDKKKNLQIYLIGRNPMSGNTVFIGIQKGRGSVQDVPEWATPFVKFHKKISVPEQPEKVKDIVPEGLSQQAQMYIDTLFNAALNGPNLGRVTNRIYKRRIKQVVDKQYPTAQDIVNEAHLLENKVVKAIKSTLERRFSPEHFSSEGRIVWGSQYSKQHLTNITFVSDVIDAWSESDIDDIYPNTKLKGISRDMWDLCSKYNYQCSYSDYMKDIIRLSNKLSTKYSGIIPICSATKGYNPQSWIQPCKEDMLIAKDVCRYILENSKYYNLPAIDNRLVEKLNNLYIIFTSKKNPESDTYHQVNNYLISCINESKRLKLTSDALTSFKVNCGKDLLRMFMGINTSENVTIDQINALYLKGSKIFIGIRDINETNIRSFGYACIHSYIKAYIKHLFPSELSRVTALFQMGRKLFGIQDGKAKSNRLFWLILSTFQKDQIMLISNLWMDSQEKKFKLSNNLRPISEQELSSTLTKGIINSSDTSESVKSVLQSTIHSTLSSLSSHSNITSNDVDTYLSFLNSISDDSDDFTEFDEFDCEDIID